MPPDVLRKAIGRYGIDCHCCPAAAFPLVIAGRSGSRLSSGLHRGQPEPCHSPAGRAHGAGDGAGVAVRRSRRVLGGPPWGERGSNGRTHGVHAEPGVRGRHWTQSVDHRDGGPPHRGKRSRGRGRCCSAGHCARHRHFAGHWTALLFLCSAPSTTDGRHAGDRFGRQRLYPNLPGRQLCRAVCS
jgi:hypothetical protein